MITFTAKDLLLENLRNERKERCFKVINRGKLWYERLTNEQIGELREWYQAWLDVTKTLVMPEEPLWLNSTLKDEEEEL